MAALSPLTAALAAPPFAADHHLDGRPILPAVEAMEWLAAAAAARFPEIRVTDLTEIRFDKFLFLNPGGGRAQAAMRLTPLAHGRLDAVLETRRQLSRAGLTRVLTHARMIFGAGGQTPPPAPPPLRGELRAVPAEAVYRELVPFGPGYRNIVGDLMIGAQGALARVRSPCGDGRPAVLGSPYVLDAAFHAACVWSQRHAGTVAFPVGLDRRRIFDPADCEIGRASCRERV